MRRSACVAFGLVILILAAMVTDMLVCLSIDPCVYFMSFSKMTSAVRSDWDMISCSGVGKDVDAHIELMCVLNDNMVPYRGYIHTKCLSLQTRTKMITYISLLTLSTKYLLYRIMT